MATQQSTGSSLKQALLFMPDISGFTRFVNETEILHSQQIIQELLEILIDSNQLGMRISEIEGDAIFFYRPGAKPPLPELLKQVETMYFNFHRHLKKYADSCICNCRACYFASNLKLKMIAHYGEVAEFEVKEYQKLYGKEVILIHRLLKNNIGENEYVLLTDALSAGGEADHGISWFSGSRGSESYDAGEVQFTFSVLSALKNKVPPPDLPHYNMSKHTRVVLTEEAEIATAIDVVSGAITDLGIRPRWMEGVREIEMMDHEKINRVGSHHCCREGSHGNTVIVTESFKREEGRMELVEMDNTGRGGYRYQLLAIGPDRTGIRIELLLKKSPVNNLLFVLFMKNRQRKKIRRSLHNLRSYLEPVEKLTAAAIQFEKSG